MEIRQLKAFLAIAEAKTFTAGARRVNVTQAAISMQIRQLEEEVGLQLFTRTPRRVILTEAGEYLLERARKILREHDSALAEIAEVAGAEMGRLRIGTASGTFAMHQLPGILQNLKHKYPNSTLTVASGTSQKLVDRMMHGEIDIAFVSLPVDNANITTESIFSDESRSLTRSIRSREKNSSAPPRSRAKILSWASRAAIRDG
jgi:LysR family transcriptional regulator, hydrogen peroxide-inducible genes activator